MILPVLVLAAEAFVAPRIGCVRESTEAIRCVYGVAGAFILGPAVAGRSAAFDSHAKLPDGTEISIDGTELVIARADGRTERVTMTGSPEAIEVMSDQWVHLVGTRRIVHVTGERIDMFVLPREERR
jgi:hypothetical protein